MKLYSKVTAAFLAVLMCLSLCAFSAFAEGEDEVSDGSSVVDDGGAGGGGGEEDGQSSEDPYYPPENNDDGAESSYGDDTYSNSVDNGEGQNDGGYDGGYESSEDTEDNGGGYVYYDGAGNSYSNTDDVYVGGGQSYQPPVSTAPPAALYETDSKIDVNELSKNDWGDIANLLKNTGGAESDGDDFAFIQKNTSKADNGHWIIIGGLVCILLSITGFIYLIASKISKRRKIKAGNITKSTPQKNSAPARANDDYNDGYGAVRQSKQSKSASHYSGGKSGKSGKGGKRYR